MIKFCIKTYDLINSFGLSLEKIDKGQICWNGKDNTIRSDCDSNAIHDLAHFIVSPLERRYLPNFGLGSCPEDSNLAESTQLVISNKASQEEEELASCLGILFEKKLKLQILSLKHKDKLTDKLEPILVDSWKQTYYYHNWNDTSDKVTFSGTIKRLQDMGIVGKNKYPFGYKRILKVIGE